MLTRRVAFKGIPTQDPDADEVTLWDVTQESTRQAMKTHFLEGLSQEPNKSVRNKICDTIAEMARASTAKKRKCLSLIIWLFHTCLWMLPNKRTNKREKSICMPFSCNMWTQHGTYHIILQDRILCQAKIWSLIILL